MLKAVIFDLDGTLLDTIPDIAGALNRALAACGLPTHPVKECEAFVGGGIREAVCRAVPDRNDTDAVERVLAHYLTDYPLHCAEQTAPYPGVKAMLTSLTERGYLLGVLSNKTESSTVKIIQTFFPDIPFRCIFGRAGDRPLKPDPAAAAPVLEALGLRPCEIAYVGDSGTDMRFAQSAGLLPVAAPWGYRSQEELITSGADLVPNSPDGLPALLEGQVV